MSRSRVLPTLLLSFGLSSVGVAAEDEAVRHLRGFLAHAATVQANFSQVTINEKGKSGPKATGVFYLQRPGKFRWNYVSPYKQEIVATGGKVWFYDVDLEQVTAKKLNQAIGSTPALLLTGEVPLEQNFTIQSEGSEGGLFWIRLIPKDEESGFRYVLMGLEGDQLAGMELADNFGQHTRIYFSDLKLGKPVDAHLFEFKPPAGVDVFEEK